MDTIAKEADPFAALSQLSFLFIHRGHLHLVIIHAPWLQSESLRVFCLTCLISGSLWASNGSIPLRDWALVQLKRFPFTNSPRTFISSGYEDR